VAPVIPLPLRGADASAPNSRTEPTAPIAAPAAVAPDCADPAAQPDPDRAPGAAEMRAELVAELGAVGAAAVPIDLLEVLWRAWGGFRGRARGP